MTVIKPFTRIPYTRVFLWIRYPLDNSAIKQRH
jgi:hypothetical protein